MNKLSKKLFLVTALALLIISDGQAQTASVGTALYSYNERLDSSSNVSALGDDLFGDNTSYENGSTYFSTTDVKVASNVRVPVQIGRRLETVGNKGGQIKYNPVPDIFGIYWKADIPYIGGVHPSEDGWLASSSRCSGAAFAVGGRNVSEIIVPAHNFYSGNDINIPGYGKERLLVLLGDGARPANGASYVGTTKSSWKISCLPTIKNGSGQGFVVTLPDGSKYYFDWMAAEEIGYVSTSRGYLYVKDMRLYATKAEDRFGGSVEYKYDPSFPNKIIQIKASDGAVIDVNYYSDNGKVASVSSGSKIWRYVYRASAERVFDSLSSVVLPDGSSWAYSGPLQLSTGSAYSPYATNCQMYPGGNYSTQEPPNYSKDFTVTHPSGAIGKFKFRLIRFGYNKTPGRCSPTNSWRPQAYDAFALYHKSISAPSVNEKSWDINYYPSWSYEYECQAGCPVSALTKITENSGRVTTYIFGNNYSTNAAQLLSKKISGSGVSREEKYEYLTSAEGQLFPDMVGEDKFQILSNIFLWKNRPISSMTVTQDGVSFVSRAIEYDSLARPTKIVRSSMRSP